MNKSPLAVLLLVSSTCFAQTPAAHILPDGSSDMYFGFGRTYGPAYEGSNVQWSYNGLNFLQAQWSNGIFVSNAEIGMHLSEDPSIEYGPLIAVGAARPRTNAPQSESVGGIYLAPSVGGFFNYNLTDSVQLTTDLLYGTSRYHGSIIADLNIRKGMRIATHHWLSASAGMTWTNARFTEIQYGITPEQAAVSDYPVYTPSAGLQDVHAGLNWNWAFNSTWMLTTRLYETHLTGSAVGSPLVEKQNNTTVSTALVYRF
jgi:outer membrane protein